MSDIVITKARMHNLKGIDVTIPRNSLTVVTCGGKNTSCPDQFAQLLESLQ